MATKFITVSIEIMHDKNLSPNQKFILAEIEQLSSLKNGCFANNKHFSELTGIKVQGVSNAINDLQRKGYIRIDNSNTYRNNGRVISIHENVESIHENVESKDNITCNITCNKEKSIKKEFSFSLKKDTHYDNLSEEYKEKLHAKCLLTDGNINRYEDFILSLQAKSTYKYKNFLLVYKAWDKQKLYKSYVPNPEPELGENWFKVVQGSKVIAINSKTLKMQIGALKTYSAQKQAQNQKRDIKSLLKVKPITEPKQQRTVNTNRGVAL